MNQRTKSLVLQKLEAVIPRLPQNHPRLPDLEYELAREMKGYIGEKRVDYFLEELAGRFTMLRGICLRVGGKRFQIDTLMITDNAIYIIEVKNVSGTVTFDTTLNQFTRDDGKEEIGFRHPVTQAELQQMRLENWLRERNHQHIPIHFFIAFGEPSTVIKVDGDTETIARLVAHGEHIPRKISAKEKELSLEGGRKIEQRLLGKAILQESEELDYDILEKFGVRPDDVRPGVHCAGCGWLGMARQHGGWHCPKCKTMRKYVPNNALSDFFLLIKSSISNKECMYFLNINSRFTATRILRQSSLVYDKKTKRWKKAVGNIGYAHAAGGIAP